MPFPSQFGTGPEACNTTDREGVGGRQRQTGCGGQRPGREKRTQNAETAGGGRNGHGGNGRTGTWPATVEDPPVDPGIGRLVSSAPVISAEGTAGAIRLSVQEGRTIRDSAPGICAPF